VVPTNPPADADVLRKQAAGSSEKGGRVQIVKSGLRNGALSLPLIDGKDRDEAVARGASGSNGCHHERQFDCYRPVVETRADVKRLSRYFARLCR